MSDDKLKTMDTTVLDVREFLEEAAGWFREFSTLADEPEWMKTRSHKFLRAASDLRTNWMAIRSNLSAD